MRCSWRENGGEGSPGSAALSLYARNNILMKERPDSEVPTSGRAAELLASPPLRGRPLPPLHVAGSAECAPCPDYSHHPPHHHTEPRSRRPPTPRPGPGSSCADVGVGESGRGPGLRRGVHLSAPGCCAVCSPAGGVGRGGGPELSRAPTTGPATAFPHRRGARLRPAKGRAEATAQKPGDEARC